MYNTLALPVLLHGWETWANREQDKYRVTPEGMKFMSRTANYMR